LGVAARIKGGFFPGVGARSSKLNDSVGSPDQNATTAA
jgi:hypothetical protein